MRLLLTLLLVFNLNSNVSAEELSNGDLAEGEQLYQRCTGCHTPAYHRTGPKHCGLMGRQAGSYADFDYSDAMKKTDIIWTESSLDLFLRAPLNNVPGTTMGFVGINSYEQRQKIIRFLESLDNNHVLCQ